MAKAPSKLKPSEKVLLTDLRGDLIKRYGTVSAAAAALGVHRSALRLAILGQCPGVLKKMQQAGIIAPQESGSVAANSYAGGCEITVSACNARPMTGDGWLQITPWGNFQNPQGIQRLNMKTGQSMVAAFNSTANADVALYRGHPDVDRQSYPDDRRLGRITALEARADGLWCKPKFNDLGQQNQEQGYWIYPSAVWTFKRLPGGVIEPTRLVSVGLTNQPIIPTVQPWAKNSAPADDLDPNPAIRAAQLLYRKTLRSAHNSDDKATMPGAANGLRVQVKSAALAYQQKHKCDFLTAWNAQKKDARFHAYFRLSVGANSIVEATTPGAAKREAKQMLKEHHERQEGYSALTAIAKKQHELMREKKMPEHEALLHAQTLLPGAAATAAAHLDKLEDVRKTKSRRENLKDFTDAVKKRMSRGTDFLAAWQKEKAVRKQAGDWTPDEGLEP